MIYPAKYILVFRFGWFIYFLIDFGYLCFIFIVVAVVVGGGEINTHTHTQQNEPNDWR